VKYARTGLGGLLALCLVVRAAAWLVAPALPLIAVLFVVTSVLSLLVSRRF